MTDGKSAPAPLRRMARILDRIAAHPDGAALNDIATAVELPTSTAYRLISSLIAIGYVEADKTLKVYRIGRRVLKLAHMGQSTSDIRAAARPALEQLGDKLEQVAYLTRLIEGEVRLVAYHMPKNTDSALIVPGALYPLHATATGKVTLAFQDHDTRHALLPKSLERFQDATITDLAALDRQLSEIRAQGFAMIDSEYDTGVFAVACPVFSPGDSVVFAFGIVGLRERVLAQQPLNHIVDALKAGATQFAMSLGSAGDDSLPPANVQSPG